MATNVKSYLAVLLFSLYVLSVTAISPSGGDPTVYEILEQFGLPRGLLPDSVQSYSLSSDGSFVVKLPKPCYIQFEYLVYYEKQITGQLKYGSITKLGGIQVQRLFFWFDVNEIRVDLPPSDSIYFQVGFINKKLSVNQFKTIHSCRDNGLISCGQSLKRALETINKKEILCTLETIHKTKDVICTSTVDFMCAPQMVRSPLWIHRMSFISLQHQLPFILQSSSSCPSQLTMCKQSSASICRR